MVTSLIVRFFRIAKHGLCFLVTRNKVHVFEIEHYFHIKKFTNFKY